MRQTAGDSSKTQKEAHEVKVPVKDLLEYLGDWNFESRLQGHTNQSTVSRTARVGKFFWFLRHKSLVAVGAIL